jgi:hypothetical protein
MTCCSFSTHFAKTEASTRRRYGSASRSRGRRTSGCSRLFWRCSSRATSGNAGSTFSCRSRGSRDTLQNGFSQPALHLLTLIAKESLFLKTDFDAALLQEVQDCFVQSEDAAPFLGLLDILATNKALTLQKPAALNLFRMRL